MALSCLFFNNGIKHTLRCPLLPICTQVRWKKIPIRKPKWKPVARSKLFRIPDYPYVPPDEQQWAIEMLEDYYRKVESLRQMFKEEMKEDPGSKENVVEQKRKEEEIFELLLEENNKENERIKAIREETMERLFQEEQLIILKQVEEHNKELELKKIKMEEIIRKEKEKVAGFITYDNIDMKIEEAIDSPINVGFGISLDGKITWDGTPPAEFERELQKRIADSLSRNRQN